MWWHSQNAILGTYPDNWIQGCTQCADWYMLLASWTYIMYNNEEYLPPPGNWPLIRFWANTWAFRWVCRRVFGTVGVSRAQLLEVSVFLSIFRSVCSCMFMCGGGGGEFMVIVINCTVLQVRLLHGGRAWSNSIVTLCLTCPRISWPAKWIQQKWRMHEVAFQYTI